jgi:DNA-3-methyladenine glycosylase
MGKIDISWYQNEDDVVQVARRLLGKILCTKINGFITKGTIVEAEAYSGDNDKACHAHGQKMTPRNKVMFGPGGHAYIYLCYGIHHLFNVVTNKRGKADAVLIRALEPVEGIDTMRLRRGLDGLEPRLTSGPGVLTQAMGISTSFNEVNLDGDTIWLEEGGEANIEIGATTRIGVGYAGEDALKPWRFYSEGCKWVSKM